MIGITTASADDSEKIVAWYREHYGPTTRRGEHSIREKPRAAICRCGAALEVTDDDIA